MFFSLSLGGTVRLVEKNLDASLPEVLFGSSDKRVSAQLATLRKQGRIRKIAPRLYTANLTDTPEAIVKRNLFAIIGNLFPNAILSHRSAFEYRPTPNGGLYLTYSYTKTTELPGVVLRFLEGPQPTVLDRKLSGELYVSGQARAFLENLQASRSNGSELKVLSQEALEEKLENILRLQGEDELNRLRDEAQRFAVDFGWEHEYKRLNSIVGALLATQPRNSLTSPLAIARSFGEPYDAQRLDLFNEVFIALEKKTFLQRPDRNTSPNAYRNFAFFESYFSNFIEGTEFGVQEAKDIIDSNVPLPSRHGDSHDVLGTYAVVSNHMLLAQTPNDFASFVKLLKARHRTLLSARLEKRPGEFKERNNYAGQTEFVDFRLVQGTLKKAFELYQALTQPFAKAAFMMFIVSEIHPFLDGNGRLARIMMNAELTRVGETKIIIPTVYRDDYMGVLRKLTRHGAVEPYIKMLERAHEFSATLYGDDFEEMQNTLRLSNAFDDSNENRLRIQTDRL